MLSGLFVHFAKHILCKELAQVGAMCHLLAIHQHLQSLALVVAGAILVLEDGQVVTRIEHTI